VTFAIAWAVLLSVVVVVTLTWPAWWVRLVLVLVSVGWVVVNRPVEGDALWELDSAHGLTVADLFGLAGVAIALLVQFSPRRPRRGRRGRRGRDQRSGARR
jgi:hypothetical protein